MKFLVRRRINGGEQTPLVRIGSRSTSTVFNPNIPSNQDQAWWSAERTMAITVREASPGFKTLTIRLDDDIILLNFLIESSVIANESFTGFRSWGNNAVTVIDMIIEN